MIEDIQSVNEIQANKQQLNKAAINPFKPLCASTEELCENKDINPQELYHNHSPVNLLL